MLNFAVSRIMRAFLTITICVTSVFVILRLAGDPSDILLPDDTLPEIKAEYRERWGIDRPMPEQYLRFLVAVTRGDLGVSFADGRAATIVVAEAIPNTLLLAGAALALALMIGIPLGIFAALKHNSALDRIVMSIAVLGFSIPTFFLGILLGQPP